MPTKIRFFGVAAYEIINRRGQHILIDPFLDENPASPVKSHQLESVDLILVSHAAWDHLGDTYEIARATGAPVVCGGEVKAYLTVRGLPTKQIRATVWGVCVEVAGVRVQPVECHHWSQIQLPDGTFASGVPMGFVVYADPDVRFYHYGDSALFSDMRLIAELYKPNIGCVGVSNPAEIMSHFPGPGEVLSGEMSPQEAAMATEWLGLGTVFPCHYLNPKNPDVEAFRKHLESRTSTSRRAPQVIVLDPGATYTVTAHG